MIGSLLRYVLLVIVRCLSNAFLSQLRLMNFIRRIGRDEIYIKYVHQLVNVSFSRFFRNFQS